jgi:hypothetical protein
MRFRLLKDIDTHKKGFTFEAKSQSKNDHGYGFVTSLDEKISVPDQSYFEKIVSLKVDMDKPLSNKRIPQDEENYET